MPAYNFQSRFAPAVEAGRKRHTVRRRRKRPTRAGDPFIAYQCQRTVLCRPIARGFITNVTPLEIHVDGSWCVGVRERLETRADGLWFVDAREWWTPEQIAAFVAADTDGLMTPDQFLRFVADNYGLPAHDLEIVYWEPEC